MNARSKKILATSAGALIAVMLPTGCAIILDPALLPGAAVTGGAVGGATGGEGAIPGMLP